MDLIVSVSVFVLCLFTIEVIYHSVSKVRDPEAKRVKRRLKALRSESDRGASVDILRKDQLGRASWMRAIPGIEQLINLIVQSNVNTSPAKVLLFTLMMMIAGYLLGFFFLSKNQVIRLALGSLFGYFPFLYLCIVRKKRMEKFERQLPDALELIARTLRAGHAFSSGLKMVSQEFDDPLGTEFQRALDEINFGVSVPDVLKNLATRVSCPDLRYFVVSVLIQRETGGNLAEIIDNMGGIIRERFKFHGRVKVLSAEGRISAIVISALPFIMAVVVYFLNPRFILTLNEDPLGRTMVTVALILMIFGILVMRKMVRIRV